MRCLCVSTKCSYLKGGGREDIEWSVELAFSPLPERAIPRMRSSSPRHELEQREMAVGSSSRKRARSQEELGASAARQQVQPSRSFPDTECYVGSDRQQPNQPVDARVNGWPAIPPWCLIQELLFLLTGAIRSMFIP